MPRRIAFDVGGTWTRVADSSSPAGVVLLEKWETPTVFTSTGLSPEAVLDEIVWQLADTAVTLGASHASVSLGMMFDPFREVVLASGPILGPWAGQFQIVEALTDLAPEVEWFVVNDVTAQAIFFFNDPRSEGRPATTITLSTGVAARRVLRGPAVEVDLHSGTQGEIGHLRHIVLYDGRALAGDCDCGVAGHLAGFVSGRGVLRCFSNVVGKQLELHQIRRLLDDDDDFAWKLWSAITRPLYDEILRIAIHSPQDVIWLTGGLTARLHTHLVTVLREHSQHDAPFGPTTPQGWLESRLRLDPEIDYDGLAGASLAASLSAQGHALHLRPGSS